jgi:hypothetical protein
MWFPGRGTQAGIMDLLVGIPRDVLVLQLGTGCISSGKNHYQQ